LFTKENNKLKKCGKAKTLVSVFALNKQKCKNSSFCFFPHQSKYIFHMLTLIRIEKSFFQFLDDIGGIICKFIMQKPFPKKISTFANVESEIGKQFLHYELLPDFVYIFLSFQTVHTMNLHLHKICMIK